MSEQTNIEWSGGKDLLAISERLKTQDNRITQNPMFCVQEKRGYRDLWDTVMVAFTEVGCEEYIKLNGHNHQRKLRIYVQSFNRCPEMMAVRDFLMSQFPGGRA